MIDLSYLTEEEQEMILSVLKRDAELKHKEEQRIKKLQKTEQDKHKLKYLTGEWFYETKSSRHSDKIHGSDIIRASMMHRKPVTIMELTQIWPGKSSFLKNENKDIFIPPELCGLIGDPSSSAHDTREDHYQVAESKPSAHPQTKPRQNPFNSKPIGLESPVKTDGHLQTGANIQQIPGNLHQVPADQQPAVESLSSLPKPCQAPQIPAEDYHEDLAEPHSSQVSEPSDSLVEQGKVNQPSTEGHFHTLTEEDESSINKVLGWVGMMSRHSAKGNERPGGQEEQNREGLEGGSDGPSPVSKAQKQASIRPLSTSKSLEGLATSPSKDERWKNEPTSGITQTMEEELVSTAPYSLSIAVLDPEQCKRLSASVPAFMHEQGNGRESDCLSVNSFCSERQRKSSTNTNTSASSGLTSVSGSVTNIYGTDFGHVEVKGTIQFAINYVNKLGELHIFIVQCRDLAAAEPKRNRTDPYVKCYLLPDKAKLGKRKTSVKKKTLNPTYNEILRYKIPLESLKVLTLNISVWHNDMFGRNSFLGEANVDLSEWDNNTHMMDRNLKGRIATPSSPTHVNHKMEMCGDMRISLRFLLQTSQSNKTPQTGEIQVWVKECTNLPTRRGTIDSFVKCSILADNHQKNRQKTQVVKRTANPVFNHTMVYEGIRPEDLRDTCVELTLWDHDRLSNHFIGGTRLGLGTGKSHGTEVKWMDSNSAESALWRRMIESNNEWVEDTIPLRMLIMAR
ncbi:synaptotagmin-like protein 2 isoform X5 [Pangasianodon hypophthalmus]|uniref:synaptotagmin-like protein 2 isoform X5 n=1 Tax=Pangasianodon hypophthalmus TaxID=310915 RepID=UPI002307989D|nr:synaptotagmin-like protein 2 isoform X5 [Pangasianodon hypophthalmus]